MSTPLSREAVAVETLQPLHNPGIPDPGVIYQVSGIPLGGVDGTGCQWVVEKTEGWHGPVARRTARSERAHGDGDHRGRAWKASRRIMIEGVCVAPSIGARQGALDRAADLCGDDGTLHELRVTDQLGRVRTADVELDEGDTRLWGDRRFRFQFQFTAPDPRKHGPWQTVVLNEPAQVASSSSYILHFPSPVWGPDLPEHRVYNHGTAWAFPFFQVRGPLPSLTIRDRLAPEAHVTIARAIEGHEIVSINCDSNRAAGFRGHAAWSSIAGSLRQFLQLGDRWPAIAPKTYGRYQLIVPSESNLTFLTVSGRSAWH